MNWYLEVLKKYATFSGRASRSEFWYFMLVNTVISVGLFLLTSLSTAQNNENLSIVLLGILLIYTVGTILPSLAVTVRRLHDISKSGWWYFISLIPVIGPFILLYFMVLDSNPGDNIYGTNPKNMKSSTTSEVNPKHRDTPVTERIIDNNQNTISFLLKPNSTTYPLISLEENSQITIGRNGSYSINNQYVSSKHLEVNQKSGQVIVKDLNSSNGTYIQGVKLDPNKFYTMQIGDKVILGSEEVVYELEYA